MSTFAATAVLLAFLPLASSRNFLAPVHREFDVAYIHAVVQESLDGVLGRGHGIDAARLLKINATLAPLVSVLPRNKHGHLSTPFMRYAVQRYFSQQHGWIVKGFEPHALNNSETQDLATARIISSKAPSYIDTVMQQAVSKGGFALKDIVTAVASIEVLIFDENLKGVESAYQLNGLPTTSLLDLNATLNGILASYFILEHLEGNASDVHQHMSDKRDIKYFYPHWPDTFQFIADVVGEDLFQRNRFMNPFTTHSFSFLDVARITRSVSERFGPYSNHECHDMKVKLSEMDVHGTGRVKLSDFYQSSLGGAWQFLETSEYLTTIGALDTSSSYLGPQVIIPNYITGSNNCITSSLYYDICCLNECDGIYQHLEARLKGPTASTAEVTRAIEQGIHLSPLLSSTAPTSARNLSQPLRAMLSQIAMYHDDVIPLHGRLFAQWLHYVFPRECPFPHMSGTVTPETVADLKARDAQLSVTTEEMKQHIQSEVGRREPSPEAGMQMWTLQEELLADSESEQDAFASQVSIVLHIIGIVSFAILVLNELQKVLRCRRTAAKTAGWYHI